MTLVPVDPKNEASVVTLLERAAQWLAEAVHRGEPGEVAAVKAQLATAAEATKQLNLSKEIQLDAQEMVRRAEYALGKAIRRGQAEGAIAKPHVSRPFRSEVDVAHPDIKRIGEFVGKGEWNGSGGRDAGINAVADVDPADFDTAIDAAKAEGNLSRANVVRKIKQASPDRSREGKADVIEDLAARGFTSRQMAERVGVSDARVREIARAFDIDIPADRVVGKQRRINHTDAIESAVTELDNWVSSLTYIDLAEADFTEADEWVSSLTNSLTELRRFIRQIKEKTHV